MLAIPGLHCSYRVHGVSITAPVFTFYTVTPHVFACTDVVTNHLGSEIGIIRVGIGWRWEKVSHVSWHLWLPEDDGVDDGSAGLWGAKALTIRSSPPYEDLLPSRQ